MPNPFDFLGVKPKPELEIFDDHVRCQCQTKGCYEVATTARYDRKNKLLMWTCPAGHESEQEYEVD